MLQSCDESSMPRREIELALRVVEGVIETAFADYSATTPLIKVIEGNKIVMHELLTGSGQWGSLIRHGYIKTDLKSHNKRRMVRHQLPRAQRLRLPRAPYTDINRLRSFYSQLH